MALVKCHECGSEVSTEAKACPKCGAKPKPPAVPVSASTQAGCVIVGLLLFGLLLWFALTVFQGNAAYKAARQAKSDKDAAAFRIRLEQLVFDDVPVMDLLQRFHVDGSRLTLTARDEWLQQPKDFRLGATSLLRQDWIEIYAGDPPKAIDLVIKNAEGREIGGFGATGVWTEPQ